MAVTATVIRQGTSATGMHIVDVEATVDGDTTHDINHGLGATPELVNIQPLVAAARISNWIVTVMDATKITVAKTTTAGSGAAGAQVRFAIQRPHSLAA